MKPYKSNEPSSSSALSSSGSENIKQGISINVCRFQVSCFMFLWFMQLT